jgi:hypothetical protein
MVGFIATTSTQQPASGCKKKQKHRRSSRHYGAQINPSAPNYLPAKPKEKPSS